MPTPELRQARLLRLRHSRSQSPPPDDFEKFWASTAQALREQDPLPRSRYAHAEHQELVCGQFDSLGGTKISCWFSSPQRFLMESGRPLIVTCHGYGGAIDPERIRRLASFGCDVVGVDARGFGLSRDALSGLSPYGYLMTGHASREECILRGAICDYVQAYRAALEWFGASTSTTFQGFSFAGGLAVMAAGLLTLAEECDVGLPVSPKMLALGAPTFGDLDRRVELCESGSGRELREYLEQHPEGREETMSIYRYFDACYFASLLGRQGTAPQIVAGVGIHDPVVPAETVYAIYNALRDAPELFELPCSHTERKEERQWVRWESAWIRAAQP